jgi:hypothetical protein
MCLWQQNSGHLSSQVAECSNNSFPPSASNFVIHTGDEAPGKRLQSGRRSFLSGVNPARWVDDHGDCLYRYALLRVRRPEVAKILYMRRGNRDGADLLGLENFAE